MINAAPTNGHGEANKTAAPLTPKFIRLPKAGHQCPHTGLSRASMNLLVLPGPWNDFKPEVKSYSLRSHGRKKGVRLVDYASLLEYIEARAEPVAA